MDLIVNAWRRRIGFICPSDLETSVGNFGSFAPEGIGLCTVTSNIGNWDKNVEWIERDARKPVIAGDPADFWVALRSLGIRDRIEVCGHLLRSLSET